MAAVPLVRVTVVDFATVPEYGVLEVCTAIAEGTSGRCIHSVGRRRVRRRSEWEQELRRWFERLARIDADITDWLYVKMPSVCHEWTDAATMCELLVLARRVAPMRLHLDSHAELEELVQTFVDEREGS